MYVFCYVFIARVHVCVKLMVRPPPPPPPLLCIRNISLISKIRKQISVRVIKCDTRFKNETHPQIVTTNILLRSQHIYRVNNQFTDASINGRLYLEKRCCSVYNSSISTSVYCPGTCTAKKSCRLQTSATL